MVCHEYFSMTMTFELCFIISFQLFSLRFNLFVVYVSLFPRKTISVFISRFIIFRQHTLGEENHNLCCVFPQILPYLHDRHPLLDYFSYLTILLLKHTRSSEIRIVTYAQSHSRIVTYAHSGKLCIVKRLVTSCFGVALKLERGNSRKSSN